MVKDNVLRARKRIAALCTKLNRDPGSIIIVGVTKNRTLAQIQELLDAGINEVGENKVQEALLKYNAMRDTSLPVRQAQYASQIKWHMVGHLQTNKAKDAVKIFDLIHSVDSLRLANEINKQAALVNKKQDILLEIKTSPEAAKSGLKPDAAIEVIKEIVKLQNLNLKGLMTIAPLVDHPEKARPYFRMLRELKDKINSLQLTADSLQLLSMGMTDDFEIAIEEGANMVRLGRVIFEG